MKKIIVLMFSAVLLFTSCKQVKKPVKNVNDPVIPVKVTELRSMNAFSTITASGQFTTDDEVYLSFKTGGIIDRIFVKEGDSLHKGQLLAVLKLTEIDAQLKQAALAYEKAKRDYERSEKLYQDSVATLEQFQNSGTMMELAKQQLEAVRFNRYHSEIRASNAGFLLNKLVNEGQAVAPGTPVFRTNGAHSTSWLLRVNVDDRQWTAVRPADKAVIYTDAGGSRSYKGLVVRKSQAIDPQTGMLTVDIQLSEKAGDLASGMFGKVMIDCSGTDQNSQDHTWSIPYEALMDANGSTGYVFVVNDNNTVSKVSVSIEGMNNNHVLISGNLEEAKSIVSTGNAYLTDKSKVQIIR